MLELTNKHLSKGGYNHDKLKKEFGVDNLNDIIKDIPYSNEVITQNVTFMVYERAYHVFAEASRVYKYRDVCEDDSIEEDVKISMLGTLMNESHFSCKVLYECSSPELDELTQMCRDNGALGSRLTGAGWGGCCVSLVRKSDVANFI